MFIFNGYNIDMICKVGEIIFNEGDVKIKILGNYFWFFGIIFRILRCD